MFFLHVSFVSLSKCVIYYSLLKRGQLFLNESLLCLLKLKPDKMQKLYNKKKTHKE